MSEKTVFFAEKPPDWCFKDDGRTLTAAGAEWFNKHGQQAQCGLATEGDQRDADD